MNVLFVCGKARMRSPTAADICAGWAGIAADFAGLSNDADERLSAEQIEWADVIAVMEPRQRTRLNALYGPLLTGKQVSVLNVPDKYAYMDADLVALLTPRLTDLLRRAT